MILDAVRDKAPSYSTTLAIVFRRRLRNAGASTSEFQTADIGSLAIYRQKRYGRATTDLCNRNGADSRRRLSNSRRSGRSIRYARWFSAIPPTQQPPGTCQARSDAARISRHQRLRRIHRHICGWPIRKRSPGRTTIRQSLGDRIISNMNGPNSRFPLKPTALAGGLSQFRPVQMVPSGTIEMCWAMSLQPLSTV